MTGVSRVGPWTASRPMTAAARTAALSSRGIDPWPHVPRTRDPIGGEALLGDLDRVEPPAGDGDRDAAALVERTGRLQPLRAMLRHPLGTGQAAGLLVGGAGEQDVASETGDRVAGRVETGRPRLRGEQPHDPELHGDHRLHVDGAAPVDVAVDELRRERVVAPAGSSAPARRRGATAGGGERRRSHRRGGERGPSRDRARVRPPRVRGPRPRGAPRCAAPRRARHRAPRVAAD